MKLVIKLITLITRKTTTKDSKTGNGVTPIIKLTRVAKLRKVKWLMALKKKMVLEIKARGGITLVGVREAPGLQVTEELLLVLAAALAAAAPNLPVNQSTENTRNKPNPNCNKATHHHKPTTTNPLTRLHKPTGTRHHRSTNSQCRKVTNNKVTSNSNNSLVNTGSHRKGTITKVTMVDVKFFSFVRI